MLSTQLRTLADTIDRVEDDLGADVLDAEARDVTDDGQLVTELMVLVPLEDDVAEGPDLEDDVEQPDEPDEEIEVEQSGDVDETDEEIEVYWCGQPDCDYSSSSEVGVARHHGQVHSGPAMIVTDPDEIGAEEDTESDEITPEKVFAELLEMVEEGHDKVQSKDLAERLDTTGSKVGYRLRVLRENGEVQRTKDDTGLSLWQPADVDDDVQEESEPEAEDVTVDAVDDDSDGDDEETVALPDGVTEADVDELTDELETLGGVADEIGVTRGRARTITHALGYYSRVRDVPSGRGGRA